MKKAACGFLAAILIFSLLSVSGGATAAGSGAYPGHWAGETMNRAFSDGLLLGSESGVSPDALLSGALAVTILGRIFQTGRAANLSEVSGLAPTDWYYSAAARAVALGIVAPENGYLRLDAPMTRGTAFTALAQAFQLAGAAPDTSLLTQYADGDALTGRTRLALAALTAAGYVTGVGNTLRPDDTISLAEFLTVLYRIVPDYRKAGTSSPESSGGTVVSGGAGINGKKFADGVYFDCQTSDIALKGVDTPRAVLRSDTLKSLSVTSSRIGCLVFAALDGDVSFNPTAAAGVSAVAVGDGGGTVTLGGSLTSLDITGSGRNVVVTGSVKNLIVSGSGCSLTLSSSSAVESLRVLGEATGCHLTINGSIGECVIYGRNAMAGGSGTVTTLIDKTSDSKISVTATHVIADPKYGLNGAALTLTAPDSVPSYKSLTASVAVSAPNSGLPCTALWYIDNVLVSRAVVSLGTTTVTLSYPARNTGNVPKPVKLSFVLSFDDPGGGYQEKRTDRNVTLENRGKFDIQDVFSLVTSEYQGDYTLDWALSHDFDSALKTAWVNLKGYTSKTEYLVWISVAYQRVNVFKGSAGNWTLIKTFVVGSGAPGTDTPVDENLYVIDRIRGGWTTENYTVKPVVYFTYYGHAFHSRLYYPNTTEIEDESIGFPVSHGCIRMYDEDISWFYATIPDMTRVVAY